VILEMISHEQLLEPMKVDDCSKILLDYTVIGHGDALVNIALISFKLSVIKPYIL
jgi:hypothetical protein